jgi:hypothetical protein
MRRRSSSASMGGSGVATDAWVRADRWASRSVVLAAPLPPHHGVAAVGRAVAALRQSAMRWRPIRISRGPAGQAYHRRLQAFSPGHCAPPRAAGVAAAPHRALCVSRGLRPGIGRHRHVGVGRPHTGALRLGQLPERRAMPHAWINDDLAPPGRALQMPAGLGDQGPRPPRRMRRPLAPVDRQRHLRRGSTQQEHGPAIDGARARVPPTSCRGAAPRTGPGPHPGSWAVVSRSGPSARPVTVAPTTPAFAKARMRPWPTASWSRTCHGPIWLARVSGQIGPGSRSPCRLAAPRGPRPWRTCGALPHPRHARRITTQQAGQGLDALPPEPRRHTIEQDVLDDGHHLAVAGGTVGLRQPHQHTAGRQEMTEGIQPRAGIEPIDPIHQVLPGQTACPSGIVAPGDLPPPPLRQGLRALVVRWPQGPPSALVGLPAREERGPSLKVLAYVGTSVPIGGPSVFCTVTSILVLRSPSH